MGPDSWTCIVLKKIKHIFFHYLFKGALCCFGEEIHTQNFNMYNIYFFCS